MFISPTTTRHRSISLCEAPPRTALIQPASRFAALIGASLPDEQFPVILGADVIYEPPLVPLVANLLGKLLAPDGVGLIASPYRVAAEAFSSATAAQGLSCRADTRSGQVR